MSVIFPGNYVAHLNAYRDQSVYALPGVEFYQLRGAYVVDEDVVGDVSGASVLILSPDLRPDDKPRLDRPMTVPAGAKVYRTAINTTNLATTGAGTIQISGTTVTGTTLTAASGAFPEEGAVSEFTGLGSISAETADPATVVVDITGGLTLENPDDQAAVLVEVCYYIDAEAPDPDDFHLPYKVEAGQGY